MADSARLLLPKGDLPSDPPPALPGLPTSHSAPPTVSIKQKRKLTLAACEPCRKRKSKCDGQRPSCSACLSKPEACVFEIKDASLSRTAALKQKVETLEVEAKELRDIIDVLQTEVTDRGELLDYLRTRPEHEAHTILQHLRNSENINSVVQYIREGDLLINTSRFSGPSTQSSDQTPP